MAKQKRKISFLGLVALGLVLYFLGREVWGQRTLFAQKFDPNYWRERYERSQWAKGFAATELMGDADLYAYAGWEQVRGGDPTLINPDQPPLGKYLLGLTILLTGNPLWLGPFLAVGCLVWTYLLAREVLGKTNWVWVPVVLLSADPLFRENLTTSMLDLPFMFFLLGFFYFFSRGFTRQSNFVPALIFLALVAGTKMHMVGLALLGVAALVVFGWSYLTGKKAWRYFLAGLPWFGLVYLLVYTAYFAYGHTLAEFKYYHFWVRHFARVYVPGYPKGEIWRIFLTGQWLIWWPEKEPFRLIGFGKWSFVWPLSLAVTLSGLKSFWRRQQPQEMSLLIWLGALMAMYSWGVAYPRYLLPVLPLVFILAVDRVKFVKRVNYGFCTKHQK